MKHIKSTLGVKVGGTASDTLTGQYVSGERGNDVVIGTANRDLLSGGFGDDLIVGQSGTDVVYGGPGRDVFRLRSDGTMQIRDFRSGSDFIQLDNDLSESAQDIQVLRTVGNKGSSLVLNGRTIADVYGVRPINSPLPTHRMES